MPPQSTPSPLLSFTKRKVRSTLLASKQISKAVVESLISRSKAVSLGLRRWSLLEEAVEP